MLERLPQELGIAAAALHSHQPQRRRLAALDRCALWHCGRVQQVGHQHGNITSYATTGLLWTLQSMSACRCSACLCSNNHCRISLQQPTVCCPFPSTGCIDDAHCSQMTSHSLAL